MISVLLLRAVLMSASGCRVDAAYVFCRNSFSIENASVIISYGAEYGLSSFKVFEVYAETH